ncbi:MAG: transposase [Deltaproteobacteria bacterium]|nr:transposase [Deltaproteobacteria bacterium]
MTKIDSVGPECALAIYSEFGADLSRFKSGKHFCSFLGLCPATNKRWQSLES